MRAAASLTRSRRATALRATGHPGDGFKTACTSAVLAALGVPPHRYVFTQCVNDVVAVLRRQGFTVRCCRRELPPVASAKTASDAITKLPHHATAYLLRVAGHVSLVSREGKTLADTDPTRQNLLITHAYRITR